MSRIKDAKDINEEGWYWAANPREKGVEWSIAYLSEDADQPDQFFMGDDFMISTEAVEWPWVFIGPLKAPSDPIPLFNSRAVQREKPLKEVPALVVVKEGRIPTLSLVGNTSPTSANGNPVPSFLNPVVPHKKHPGLAQAIRDLNDA